MFVIVRRRGDKVKIGSDIELKVVQTGRNRVSIAIDAPREVRIQRVDADEPTPTPAQDGAVIKAKE